MPDGGGPTGGSSDLEHGVGALKQFRSRVHAILADFEAGEAGTAKVAAHTLSRACFGAPGIPFPEADDLYAQYRRVHTGLVKLSRSLTEQIDCLSIAVHGAEIGFDNLEEDLRRRFWSIRSRTDHTPDHAPDHVPDCAPDHAPDCAPDRARDGRRSE